MEKKEVIDLKTNAAYSENWDMQWIFFIFNCVTQNTISKT